VDVTFVVPVFGHPYGGTTALYEFAGGLRRRGHRVHLVHINLSGGRLDGIADIHWFDFEPGIDQQFASHDNWTLPQADFIVHPPQAGLPERYGLPLLFVQGYGMFPPLEEPGFRLPWPKVCVATWLVDAVRRFGVPQQQLIHVPCGLKHKKYRLVSPIEDRPCQVAICYNPHATKGLEFGLESLSEVKNRVPELRAVVFGTEPAHAIPSWMTYLESPRQEAIVSEIYNGSRIFINSSIVEGFGLPCVEAMACGSALVTTANGGSQDYAIHGETALVSQPRDVDAMADQIESLFVDDELRIRLARAGRQYVRRFDWDESAKMLEGFLERYEQDPEYYQGS
jgi:glycosyltransferase involved in cell wall biosynthesis